MNVALYWYRRFQHLAQEATKFGVVGAVGLVITNGGYYLMHNRMGIGPVTATTVATIVATVVAYLGNRYWSFQHRARTTVAREGVVFAVLNGVGLAVQSGVVGFNYYVLGFQHNKVEQFVALNFGIALATLFRFWSYRKWVWAAPVPAMGTAAHAHQALRTASHGQFAPGRDGHGRHAASHEGHTGREPLWLNGHVLHEAGTQPGQSAMGG